MALSVRQLVALPTLQTRVVAGATGVDRSLSWAHVSELPEPGLWLRGGELVMTTGLAISADHDEQEKYLRGLADAGGHALAVAEDHNAPPLSSRMLAAADELGFPILVTAYEVAFADMARFVAEANAGQVHEELARVQRVYDIVRDAVRTGAGMREVLRRLNRVVGGELYLLDADGGVPLLGAAPPDAMLDRVTAALDDFRERGRHLPAYVRLDAAGEHGVVLPISASRPAVLLITYEGEAEDLPVLSHVALLLATEVERLASERERRRRVGAELLGRLLDHRESVEVAGDHLAEWGLGEEPRVVAACGPPETRHGADDDLHHRLAVRGVPHLLLRSHGLLVLLLPNDEEHIATVEAQLRQYRAVGLSAPIGHLGRLADGLREARFALEVALRSGATVQAYGGETGGALPFPLNLRDAERLAVDALGAVRDYDGHHESSLLESLAVFLDHNRSWQQSASALHVHKQTLAYRLRRVEDLTGRRLTVTGDIAYLWWGLQSARALGWFDA